jgi:hypothetical protein
MLKLDNNLLDELGLGGLPEDQKRAMLQHIYDTLELRVGTNLANQMTDQQLEEFEKFIDDGGDANQAQALQWLEANLPNYKQVVNEVFEALKAEVKQMAPQIMMTTAQQPMGQVPAQVQPPQPMSPYPQQPISAGQQPGQDYMAPMPQMPVQPQQSYQQPQVAPYQPPMPPSPAAAPPQPNMPEPPQPFQPQQDAGSYQPPIQQPPAGPGGYR